VGRTVGELGCALGVASIGELGTVDGERDTTPAADTFIEAEGAGEPAVATPPLSRHPASPTLLTTNTNTVAELAVYIAP
jgi:hypothetical protein